MTKKSIYICDNCGAEIFFRDTEHIKECSYCGNILAVIKEQIMNIGINKIIPFEIDKKEVIENLKEIYNSNEIFDFTLEKVYLPMYLCSFDMSGFAEYEVKSADDTITKEIWISGNVDNHLYPAQENIEDLIGFSYIKKSAIVDYDPIISNDSTIEMDNIIHHERVCDAIAYKFLRQRVKECTNVFSITIKAANENNKKVDLVLVPFFCFRDKNNHKKYILARKNIGLLLKREKMYDKKMIIFSSIGGLGLGVGFLLMMKSFLYWILGIFIAIISFGRFCYLKQQKDLIHKIPGNYTITRNEVKM